MRCPPGDLNPHDRSHWNLNPARLPIPPDGPIDQLNHASWRTPSIKPSHLDQARHLNQDSPLSDQHNEGHSPQPLMVATLAGLGALLLGLALLLLPLLATELSRPGDSAWGALVLVLALVLVTSADRLIGSPMLAVISGGLLIGRLTVEVGQGRWRQLSPEEQGRLGSWERWRTSFSQASTSLLGVMEGLGQSASGLGGWWQERRQPKTSGKRWVRPEDETPASPGADGSETPLNQTDRTRPPAQPQTWWLCAISRKWMPSSRPPLKKPPRGKELRRKGSSFQRTITKARRPGTQGSVLQAGRDNPHLPPKASCPPHRLLFPRPTKTPSICWTPLLRCGPTPA